MISTYAMDVLATLWKLHVKHIVDIRDVPYLTFDKLDRTGPKQDDKIRYPAGFPSQARYQTRATARCRSALTRAVVRGTQRSHRSTSIHASAIPGFGGPNQGHSARASTTPPSALTITTRNGAARHAVSNTKPSTTRPKSPRVLTALIQ